jgi:murein DD-endopeptidase MepM/ murein hydrolase activator NlpD
LRRLAPNFESKPKFTIHPFRSLHSRHLLPLSIPDYVARFGLELVVVLIAAFAVFANMTLSARANLSDNRDQSMIFSFLSQNPDLNTPLIAVNETSTILGQNDQWIARAQAAETQQVVLASASSTNDSSNASSTIQDNVIVKTNPADTSNLRHGKTNYEVQTGDNLITIASSFGISPATIIKENNLDVGGVIKPGQDLTILPVDGISYTLKSGDTLEAIANRNKVSLDDLLEVNDLELESDVQIGDNLVIPTQVTLPAPAAKKFVTNNSGQVKLTQATAPVSLSAGDLSFSWPTTTHTITQGFSSRHSGLDISDSKMEPIYAAESGFVEISGFQTNGYGNTIVINHGSGFKTRYGHASELYVKAGEYVTKGQLIAKQGHTGHVRGATGIHLHFEIIKNGVHVNPLNYVRP